MNAETVDRFVSDCIRAAEKRGWGFTSRDGEIFTFTRGDKTLDLRRSACWPTDYAGGEGEMALVNWMRRLDGEDGSVSR